MSVNQLIHGEWSENRVDWTKLRGEKCFQSTPKSEYLSCSEQDIDNFVEIVFREKAEALGEKYDSVKHIFYGKNIQFFEEKSRYFAKNLRVLTHKEYFVKLKKLLKLPNWYGKNEADRFIADFYELDIQTKIKVLYEFSKLDVCINSDHSGEPFNSLFSKIREMDITETTEFLMDVFNARVYYTDKK